MALRNAVAIALLLVPAGAEAQATRGQIATFLVHLFRRQRRPEIRITLLVTSQHLPSQFSFFAPRTGLSATAMD